MNWLHVYGGTGIWISIFFSLKQTYRCFKRIIHFKMLLFKIEGAEKISSTTNFKEKPIVDLKGFFFSSKQFTERKHKAFDYHCTFNFETEDVKLGSLMKLRDCHFTPCTFHWWQNLVSTTNTFSKCRIMWHFSAERFWRPRKTGGKTQINNANLFREQEQVR